MKEDNTLLFDEEYMSIKKDKKMYINNVLLKRTINRVAREKVNSLTNYLKYTSLKQDEKIKELEKQMKNIYLEVNALKEEIKTLKK